MGINFGAIPLSNIASIPAGTIVGNNGGGTAAPSALTVSQAAALLGILPAPQGRLTLTTATPVLTTTVSGATTIFYTPYVGNIVPIFDGTNLVPTVFAELSNITTNSAVGNAGPAAVTTNLPYDLFVWNNASVITLTRSPAWSSLTTRGFTLTRQNGILLNTTTITNGPAALRGTYVGTVASNGTSTIDYIFGASASGGTAASLQVWNAYNRVSTGTNVIDNGTAYTYTSSTIRQARASAGNQISFVLGLNEDAVAASYAGAFSTATALNAQAQAGLGFDSLTTFTGQKFLVNDAIATAGASGSGSTQAMWSPGIGGHVLSANEAGDNVNANAFNANSTNTLSAVIRN